ncbi:B- and T-lymphocyte attenuator [Emydura macquarii macquarii]|uniref:B- and T-lymphocyte attenuator n=1 Tax=Emydura macquarii macquarii TaxID=1129001 RepID=UPI00352B77E8
MKAPPGMRANRILLHIVLVVLSLANRQAYGNVTGNCTVELQVSRLTKYRSQPGKSLSIKCPVKYCSEKPAMNWCKIEQNGCFPLKDGPTKQTNWTEENVFVLTFLSIYQNDSGWYRCKTVGGNLNSQSHAITIVVQEVATNTTRNPPTKEFAGTTSVTEDPQGPRSNNKKWIIYVLSSLGALCLLILICICWLCCLWRHQVKHKTTPVTSERKMSMVSQPPHAPYHTDETMKTPNEGSTLYYCSMASLQQQSDDSTIYDNNVPHWNGCRAAIGSTCDSAAVCSHQSSSESQDDLVYASLNHSAILEKLPRKEQDVEIELTEYATICVKK